MTPVRVLTVMLLVSAILAGCSEAPEEVAPLLEADVGQGVIHGIVVDATIAPMAGVTIAILNHNATAVTDEDGRFGFSNVDAGVYRLRATLTGHGDQELTAPVEPGNLNPKLLQFEMVRIPGTEPVAIAAKHDAWISCELLIAAFPTSCSTAVPVFGAADNRIQISVDDRVPDAVHVEFGWVANQDAANSLSMIYGTCSDDQYCDPFPPEETFMCQTWGPSPLYCRVTQTGVERNGAGSAYQNIMESKHGQKPPTSLSIHIGADCAPCFPAPYDELGIGIALEQGVETFVWSFYNFEPADGWSFVNDGSPVVPA
jgi:hypothetical protein